MTHLLRCAAALELAAERLWSALPTDPVRMRLLADMRSLALRAELVANISCPGPYTADLRLRLMHLIDALDAIEPGAAAEARAALG